MVFNLSVKPVQIKGETRIINDIEYGILLNEAIEYGKRAHAAARGTWEQGFFEKRLEVLHRNRADYDSKRLDGSMRAAPYSIFIWGGSGVGKTVVSQLVMADCLNAANVNPDFKGVAILKENDKFDSALKGDTVGIFLDDLGNTRKEFLQNSPTDRLIAINNNAITYANKADLREKGVIEIRPKVLVITSNAPLSTHGHNGSIEPFSIVRRGDIHIHLSVKHAYRTPDNRLDRDKVSAVFPDTTMANDVWDCDIYYPREKSGGGNCCHLINADYSSDGHYTLNIHETLRLCATNCKKHFETQERLIQKSTNLIASRKYCKTCLYAESLCTCRSNFF
jgi:hypothetical protein